LQKIKANILFKNAETLSMAAGEMHEAADLT